MSKEDSHVVLFNLSSSIGSNTRILIPFPGDYEVWILNFEYYIARIEENGPYI